MKQDDQVTLQALAEPADLVLKSPVEKPKVPVQHQQGQGPISQILKQLSSAVDQLLCQAGSMTPLLLGRVFPVWQRPIN